MRDWVNRFGHQFAAKVRRDRSAVGYTDIPAFYRVFRKVTGQTPAAFRASVAEDAGAG